MINLLPDEEKQKLIEEERWELVFILETLIILFFISLSLVLLSINLTIASQLEEQQILLKQAQERLHQTNAEALKEKISNLNKNLLDLSSFYQNQVYLTGVFEKTSQILPEDIYLKDFSYQKNDRGITVFGYSPTRDKLVELKRNLEKEKMFEQIYFPPKNWVKPKGIEFDFTLKLRK